MQKIKFLYENKQIGLRLLFYVVLDAICIYLTYLQLTHRTIAYSLLFSTASLAITTLILVLANRSFRTIGKYERGLEGISEVTETLKTLPPEYKVIPDVVISNKGNIDIVVVGPTGVWALEVKSHKGNITYDSSTKWFKQGNHYVEKDFITQVWAEALTLKDFLKEKLSREIRVQPVIVFSSNLSYLHIGLSPVNGVFVINAIWLKKLIMEKPHQQLEHNDIYTINDILKA